MFDAPSGVLQGNLLGDVSFSNVTLSSANSSAAPEPSTSVLLLLGGGFCALAKLLHGGRKSLQQEVRERA